MSYSCQKQEILNNNKIQETTYVEDLPEIKVEHNVLIFKDKQDLEKANIILSIMKIDDYLVWCESIGFNSLAKVYDDAMKAELELSEFYEKLEEQNIIPDKIKKHSDLMMKCLKKVDYLKSNLAQKPVVNCFFTTDSTFKVYVGLTTEIFSEESDSVPDASVIVYENENNAVTTNEFGFFSLKIEANKAVKIKCKYLGYQEYEKTFNSTKNVTFNFSLVSNASISSITVYGTKRQDMDSYSFSTERIKKLPSLTGEKDVLKILQLMPGVQFGNEGTSDLYVRGGTPDQNLILVDDLPMHFVNHLGSFVSIFDVNAVNKITLIKNGFPAKYGGHLSSVIDIRLKDGNMEKTEGEFSIGIISSKISLNGPIIKNKLSYVFTLRHSNFEIITYPYSYISKEPFFNNYGFL